MSPGSRIVVGVRDAESTGRTLAWAIREAAAIAADLVVVRADVPSQDVLRAAGSSSVTALEVLEPSLARAVAAAKLTLGERRVSIIIDRDPAAEVLNQVAHRDDLLVLGPPSRPRWWARASTTYRVATRSLCPVVIVHPSVGPAPEGIGRVLRSHVVVGVDGSTPAREALRFGFTFAADHRLPVAAVSVTHHTDNDVWFDDRLLETHLGAEPKPATMLAREVEPWELKFPGVAVKRALVAGHPVEALRRAARGAAVLVVGAHGSGFAPLGSLARDLVESAPCAVGVVRVGP